MWVDPGRYGWRIFEGGTGSTLPMPCCEDDDDDDDISSMSVNQSDFYVNSLSHILTHSSYGLFQS